MPFLSIDHGVSILQADDIYVDASSMAVVMDGTSWANAFDDLQDALDIAGSGDVIHVAEGVYYPSAADVTESFIMLDGVEILRWADAEPGQASLPQCRNTASQR